ncbi:hypothetical protein [Shewanella sp. Pdp11]|uniref:hypothetical protein n=1 Tax=Shewanella sp. Pdp11 TaxID=2059264 RepID=UPI001E5A8850|nr:hypothetical protein [Shewanella sp. Pdp11]
MFDNPALLLWSLVFSLIGLGFFTYGKRQAAPIPLVVGLTPDDLPLFCHQSRITYRHRHRPHRTPLFYEDLIF